MEKQPTSDNWQILCGMFGWNIVRPTPRGAEFLHKDLIIRNRCSGENTDHPNDGWHPSQTAAEQTLQNWRDKRQSLEKLHASFRNSTVKTSPHKSTPFSPIEGVSLFNNQRQDDGPTIYVDGNNVGWYDITEISEPVRIVRGPGMAYGRPNENRIVMDYIELLTNFRNVIRSESPRLFGHSHRHESTLQPGTLIATAPGMTFTTFGAEIRRGTTF